MDIGRVECATITLDMRLLNGNGALLNLLHVCFSSLRWMFWEFSYCRLQHFSKVIITAPSWRKGLKVNV